MKQILLIICLFLIAFTSSFSQTNHFGKITKEEWEINKCRFDSISNLLILFDVGNISVEWDGAGNNYDPDCKLQSNFFSLVYERHLRVKILKKGELCVNFLSFILRSIDEKKDYLKYFKGISLRQENGKEVKIKFDISYLKKEKQEDGSCIISFKLPDTKEGSIIDLNYIIKTDIFNETPEWNFSNDFPTQYSEINFYIPVFFQYQKKCEITHMLKYESYKQSEKHGVSYTIEPRRESRYYSYIYDINHESYSISNIPASQNLKGNYKFKYSTNYIDFSAVPRRLK